MQASINPCFTTFLIRTRVSQQANATLDDFLLGSFFTKPKVSVNSGQKCDDGSGFAVTATVQGGVGPLTYDWTVPGGATDPGNVASFQATVTGTYTVTVTGSNGCASDPASGSVTIKPALGLDLSKTDVKCFNGSDGTITAEGSGGPGTYTYKLSQIGKPPITNQTGEFTGLGDGTYTVEVSAANSCPTSKSISIGQPTALVASASATPILCNGGKSTVTVSGNGGTPDYTFALDNDTYQASATFSNVSAGPHTAKVKDENGCVDTYNFTISQPAQLTLSCGAGNPQTNCASPNGSLSVKAAGGTGLYQYSINNGAFSSPTANTTYTFSNLAAGTYTIKVKDANGCDATASCGVKTGGFRTQTQGGWGSDPSGGNPGAYMRQVVTINGIPKTRFDHAFPSGVTVGDVVPYATDNCAGYTLKLVTLNGVKGVDAVTAFLPSGSTARKLDKNYVDPGQSYQNVFAAQVVALTLSVGFDNKFSDFGSSTTLLKNLYVNMDPFKGLTVGQVLAEANKALGGCYTKFTLIQLHNAVSAINENFVDGQIKGSILVCANPKPVVASAGREGADLSQVEPAAAQPIVMTAFPNPAYGEATIQFTVAQTVEAALEVYNTRGDKVKTLFNGVAEGGKTYEVTLTPDDRIVPGAYIYRVQAGANSKSSRLIMLKQ